MSNWRTCTIGDLVKEKVIFPPMDGNHGDIHPKGNDFVSEGIPFVMASDINDSLINLKGCKYISKKQADRLRKGFAHEGDILLTHKATIGRTAVVPHTEYPYLMLTPQVTYYRVINSDELNNRFLKYYFDYKPFQETLGLWAGAGSTRAYLGITGQHNLTIRIPDIGTQKNIAAVLTVIDKKIELNNRINAELEAMAKTLYDYWFVQFDFPDANDKPYKTSGGKMVYNPPLKREIPEGWSDGTLGEIAELYQPKTISEKEMTEDGEFLVYGANGIVGRYAQYNHEQSVVAVTCRGNSCGEINVTRPYSWITGNAMIVNTHSHLLPPTYIYNLLRSSGLENVITGSAQPQITRTNLAPMKIIRPAEKVLTNYARFVKPNFEKRIEILDENEKLEKLRDWLLPMLMNGQVTVTSSTQSKAKEA